MSKSEAVFFINQGTWAIALPSNLALGKSLNLSESVVSSSEFLLSLMYDITDPLRLKPEMFVKISTKSADKSDFFSSPKSRSPPDFLLEICDIRTPFLKINN